MSISSPARLHFLLARDKPIGVILRRGPSGWVRLTRWCTETDTFEPGQWLHARVRENCCDLSPSGKHFAYTAEKPTRTQAATSYGEQWAAVSRPPWFTALALWPLDGPSARGIRFITNRRVMISPGFNLMPHAPHPDHKPPTWLKDSSLGILGTLLGGRPIQTRDKQIIGSKPDPSKQFALALQPLPQTARRKKPTQPWHATVTEKRSGQPFDLGLVNWADWDHRGRIVFTRDGKLFATSVSSSGIAAPAELADFNHERPESIPPPASAMDRTAP